MRGFYAERLNGMCTVGGGSCRPFPFMSCHVGVGVTRLAQPMTDVTEYGTGKWSPTPVTQGAVGFSYNTLNDELKTITLPNRYYSADIASWNPRTVPDPLFPMYSMTYEGPSFRNTQCVIGLADRDPTTIANHPGRKDAWFTDPSPGNQLNMYGEYVGCDWLGFLWPGSYMYTPVNMAKPLKAENYFEDSEGTFNPTVQRVIEYNFLEFAAAVPTYDDAGVLLGSYVGLTFIPIFGAAALRNPVSPRPTDPSIPFPPGGLVTPENHFVSLDLWVYLAATPAEGKTLKSPRITTLRWWVPKHDLVTFGNVSWCDKYMYLTFKLNDTTYNPTVRFRTLDAGWQSKKLTLSRLTAYMVA